MKSDQNIYTKDIKLQHFYKFLWRSIPLRKEQTLKTQFYQDRLNCINCNIIFLKN